MRLSFFIALVLVLGAFGTMTITTETVSASGWTTVQTANLTAYAPGWTTVQTTNLSVNNIPIGGQWVSVQSTDLKLAAADNPISGADTTLSLMTFILFMMLIWLPSMFVGLLAPVYGTSIMAAVMGVMITVAYPSFLIVAVMIFGTVALVLYRQGGDA